MQIEVQGGDLNSALRDLKMMIAKDGLFRILKDRQEPSLSVRRRTKERKAERRRLKRNGTRNEVRRAS